MELKETFTYLVFRHALRIRFKSDAANEGEDEKDDIMPTDSATTPSMIEADSNAESEDTEVESESRAETETLVTEEPALVKDQAKERTAHLTGKINNLITGDLSIIGDSFSIVAIRRPHSLI